MSSLAEITFESQIKAERSEIPGDTRLTLTEDAVSIDGITLGVGSVVQPSSHGNQGYTYRVIRAVEVAS